MSNIAVCFKWVKDEADVTTDESTKALKTDRATYKISDYDRNAIEVGAQMTESDEGTTLTAVTAGIPGATTGFKDALSRGADRGLLVADEIFDDADPAIIAKVLAAALDATGPYDLILFGEGSSDLYAQQVGPRVAELLGLPVITYANKLEVTDGVVSAERRLENETEVLSCPLPVVVTVSPDINQPRIPGMKQILAARKKPLEEMSLSDLGFNGFESPVDGRSLEGAVMNRKNILFDGEIPEAVSKLADAIIREGVIK
ncbi:MAG: electron transfer flavoprotein subunit beta/FixA family protein [Coriobacteriales bacterium]|jgi:electron transfer flavoprotein beta subunit